ncbi:hypothetical protein OH76DRAFT_1136218 [Lentinus brumalis]|uniref:F-box domain-containing protein n=1 Tax=Lentinus brumalis TaxID=2498619 RepID=A0A371DM61_9APHY|nr:hypothetical protein OH76DRAFT_1136218 [Polyporus brumalis]
MEMDLDTHLGTEVVARRMGGMPTSETEMQRQLREKITFHSHQAAQLKSLLNIRLPIAKLPPEILSEVFLNQAAMLRQERVELHTTSTAGDLDIHKSFYQWLNVSHVCRHWREVAHNCANLWTWAAFEERVRESFIDDILRRAVKLPLTYVHTINAAGHCPSCISMDGFYGAGYSGLDFLVKWIPRIRDLSIYIERDDFENMWKRLEEPDAPILEKLRIEAVGSARIRREALVATVTLEDAAFQTQLPSLHSLTLKEIQFDLMHTLLHTSPSLRHLEITSCVCGKDEDLPLFGDFLQVLHDMPNLETLTLDWSLEDMEAEGRYRIPPLPHLRLLRLSSRPGFLVTLIRYLDIPGKPATTVHYEYTEDDFIEDDDGLDVVEAALKASLLSLFKQRSPSTIAYGARSSTSPADDQVFTSCRIWASDLSAAVDKPQHPPSGDSGLELDNVPPRLIYDDAKSDRFSVIPAEDVARRLDLSNVHTVHLTEWDDEASDLSWDRWLEDAFTASTLRLTGTAVRGLKAMFADGLGRDAAMDPTEVDDGDNAGSVGSGQIARGGPSASRVIFPNLRVLQFVDVKLCYNSHNQDRWLDPDLLVAGLSLRRQYRAPDLLRVEFKGCRSTDEELMKLLPLLTESLVSELRWDGRPLRLPTPSS